MPYQHFKILKILSLTAMMWACCLIVTINHLIIKKNQIVSLLVKYVLIIKNGVIGWAPL